LDDDFRKVIMAQPQDPQLADNPLYVSRSERAKAGKPPSRSSALGAVAQSRFPGAASRSEMVQGILAQDRDLVAGSFGTVYYKPVNVCGVDLKLEPVQPSIGTIVHGLDLATDLDDPEMVAFLRQLWLERRVIMFRGQMHLCREQMVAFAQHFGEVGAPFGEREHIPNSPHDLNQQIKVPGIPDMLVLPSDETVPNAASGWHSDATWQSRPPMASVLMCREAPPVGGDTCFCDCYSMWEGLPLQTKQRVEHLTAVHVGTVGHQMDGKTPSATHPVARTHPETGRTSLYVQQGFVRTFAKNHAVPQAEEKALLLQMKAQEGRPEYTCRFRWEPGSIAMWDNRAVLHTASADFWPHRRLMERLTILDYDVSRRTPYYAPQY
jgi:taurine dioxygenase